MNGTLRFISAGAGSGKTYRLTELLHDMLIDGPVRPEGILATSFTNKSAAELRERVRSHLIEKGRYGLATDIGQARIGTVNSVCGNLLGRFAFEAGMPVEQRVLDEARAGQMLQESIDEIVDGRMLTQLLTVAHRLYLDQAPRGDGPDPWRVALGNIVSLARSNAIGPDTLRSMGPHNADQLLGLFPLVTTRDLDSELLALIRSALSTLRQAQSVKAQKNTGDYIQQVEEFVDALAQGDFRWSQWNKLANADPGTKLRNVVQPITDLARDHAKHPRLQQDVRDYLETVFSLAAEVLENYRARKRQLGAVDFTDQECELLEILDLPAVAETLTAELDLLMVDEFQDTSPIQLALFLKLAQYAKHVVWVGDVKQAIYGFRGGDATLMEAVVKGLAAIKGEQETLEYSWRSRPALVHSVNQLFGTAFPGLTPGDVHLKPKRPEFGGTNAIEDWWLEGNVDQQCHGIAAGIATLLQGDVQIVDRKTQILRPLRLGDIAVLARSNFMVNQIAGVLQSEGIMASTEQPGLLRKPEIVLALACLRRLNDERDTVATAEIVSLAECEDPERWLTDRLAWLDTGSPPTTWRDAGDTINPLFRAIQTLREQRSHLSPQEAVHLLVARCNLARCVLQWQQSPERARLRLANLQRLTELAAEYEDACRSTREAATLSGLLLWLDELARLDDDTMPQPAVDAVQVITHHAAKGLEWPVVILVDLASDVKDSIWDAVRAESLGDFDLHHPLKDRHLRYWPWPYGAQSKVPVRDDIATSPPAQTVSNKAQEEHTRLLYVSMTRARDLLVIARQTKKLDGEWMATVGLAGFLPDADSPAISLQDGKSVPFVRRHLKPGSTTVANAPPIGDLCWFEAPAEPTEKLPLAVSPSQAPPVQAQVAESIQVGTRIAVDRTSDPALLGTALHACLAAYLVSRNTPLTEPEVDAILVRHGVNEIVSVADVLRQLAAVRIWLDERWPNAKAAVEVPITRVLKNGQVLSGRIDLLLKTDDGWILLDHKSGPQNRSQWDNLATDYGGQLAAYRAAIEAITGIPVKETWLVLPVAGAGLRIENTNGAK
jgi:ATP-dependent helicase/nuclease subunit A